MSKRFFAVAFAIGLATIAWVGAGFAGTSWIALAITVVIAGVYLLGAFELQQFRAASNGLSAALADIPQPLSALADWLERVPPALRNAVRSRIESERGGLPGPALTPYLVGLLVMLGMLGTFLGMVVTFKGAVFALEGSADLQAMRSALAEPIKGLGLAFGTSVAGVAASAMLGLMSAISRRERLEVSRQLETRIATLLRPFSLAHQRDENFRALQLQATALPVVVDRLEAMMERIERRSQQLDEQLLDRQARFHGDAALAYSGLADSVGASLRDSLAAGAKAAGDSIRPVLESAMAQVVHESQRMHQRVGDAAQAQVDGIQRTAAMLADAFEQRSAALLAQVREHVSLAAERDNLALKERSGLLEEFGALLQAVNQASGEQRTAIEALVASAASVLDRAGTQFAESLDAHAAKAADVATHVSASAIELASLGEAFGQGVQLFQASNDKLMDSLQRIETSIERSTARSDEQLAYYVAQAREVIDLSIASQQGLVENLRHLHGKPAAVANGARG